MKSSKVKSEQLYFVFSKYKDECNWIYFGEYSDKKDAEDSMEQHEEYKNVDYFVIKGSECVVEPGSPKYPQVIND